MTEKHQARVRYRGRDGDCFIVIFAEGGWDERRWWNFRRGCWDDCEEMREHLEELYAPAGEAQAVLAHAQDVWDAQRALEAL